MPGGEIGEIAGLQRIQIQRACGPGKAAIHVPSQIPNQADMNRAQGAGVNLDAGLR